MGKHHITHGLSHTRVYRIWTGMRQRCENPNNPDFHHYGGRGIKVCAEWSDVSVFYKWCMANGYGDKLTIDRIDFNLGYSPENCRWATNFVQQNNKPNNRLITFNGKTRNMRQWAKELNINYRTLSMRINKLGMEPTAALEYKNTRQNKLTLGKCLEIIAFRNSGAKYREIKERFEIPTGTIHRIINLNYNPIMEL